MLIKVDGKGPWVDTKKDWGFKDDVSFATAMFDKSRRLEAEATLKNIEIGRLNDQIEEMKRTGVKRTEVDVEKAEATFLEAEKGENIYAYVMRIANFAYDNKCGVEGLFNDIKFSFGPNTSQEYLLGYYFGAQSKKE